MTRLHPTWCVYSTSKGHRAEASNDTLEGLSDLGIEYNIGDSKDLVEEFYAGPDSGMVLDIVSKGY